MSGGVLLFVESNTSGTGPLFVMSARAMGLRPVLLTSNPARYPFLTEPGAPEVALVPDVGQPHHEDALYRKIHELFAGGRDLAGITSSSEYFIATAAALAARFGLPGPNPAAVRAARNKATQREMLAAHGLPSPSFSVASSVADARRAATEIGLPVVIKPLSGTGSMGVRACASASEAGRHAASLLSRGEGRVLVESLIDGPEYSVEVFSGQVIGITRKHLGAPPTFVEVGHDYPAPVSEETARALTEVATAGTAALSLGWGPVHWEFRMRGGRAYSMEVNPRLAGGFIPELVRVAEGIDLIRETVRLTIAEPPQLKRSRRECASIRFLVPPRAGRFVAVDGFSRARSIAGVCDVSFYRGVGDELAVAGDFRDRIGHVIARAARSDAAASIATRARDMLGIRVAETVIETDMAMAGSRAS